MAIIGAITALFKAETSSWTKGCNQAGQDLDKLNKKSKGFFKDMKSQFGKGSLLGQSLKLAAGGGAIAGLTMALHEIGAMADKIIDIKAQFKAGTITAGELTDQLLKTLPVFGAMYEDALKIREIFTGEEAAAAEMFKKRNAANLQGVSLGEKTIELAKRLKAAQHDVTVEFLEQRRAQMQQLGAIGKTGLSKTIYDAANQAGDTSRGIDKTIQSKFGEEFKEAKKQYESTGGALDALGDRYDAARSKLQSMTKGTAAYAKQQDVVNQLHDQYDTVKKTYSSAYNNYMRVKDAQAQATATAAPNKKLATSIAVSTVLQDMVDKGKEFSEAQKEQGKALTEAFESPMEKYRKAMTDLQYQFRAKNISKETLARGAFDAYDKLQQSIPTIDLSRNKGEEIDGHKSVTEADIPQPIMKLPQIAQAQLDAILAGNKISAEMQKAAQNIVVYKLPG